MIGRPSHDLCEVEAKTKIVKFGGCCMNDEAKKFKCEACSVKFD